MPAIDGLEATRRLLAADARAARVLILTTFDLDEYVYEALRAGASGFLLKDARPTTRRRRPRRRRRRRPARARRHPTADRGVRPPATAPAPHAARVEALTERELEVLLHIARGPTNAEIAEQLYSPTKPSRPTSAASS